jgi:hypothetical protein
LATLVHSSAQVGRVNTVQGEREVGWLSLTYGTDEISGREPKSWGHGLEIALTLKFSFRAYGLPSSFHVK